jgi:hypothetical protein
MYEPPDPFRFFCPRRILKKIRRALRKISPGKPRLKLGKVWLRLSYYDEVLKKLDEEDQKIFIDEFYSSSRQVNYITMLTCIVIIAVYVATYQFRMIGFWEAMGIEAIIILLLFYVVWYYRMGMEDLLKYLVKKETVPDYADTD